MKNAVIVLPVALMISLLAFLIVLAATPTLEAQTTSNPVLQRLGENDLPVIHTQKGFSTLIEFPAETKIREVTCGDKDFWVIESSGGRFLHVKPAKEGTVTNLNVLMEGDIVYAFILREVTRAGTGKESADLRVSINPGEDPAKLRSRLDASEQEKESLRTSLAESQHALADLNQKYLQAQKDKDENCKTIVNGGVTLRTCNTPAPVNRSDAPVYPEQLRYTPPRTR